MATSFKDIQEILNNAVDNKPTIGTHGKFWEVSEGKPMTRDNFVKLSIFGCKIIDDVNWNGPESHLVKILQEDGVCDNSQMPQGGFPFLSAATIQIISDWISAGAPEDSDAA